MKWFRHFAHAHSSESLEEIINEFGYEGYGRYWKLLEHLAIKYDGESTTFRIHSRLLRDWLRFRSDLQLSRYLLAIGLQAFLNITKDDKHYIIKAPILFELQDKDSKYNRKRVAMPSQPAILEEEEEQRIKKKNNTKAEKVIFDFNVIYSHYPKKAGKKKGLEYCVKKIKTQDQFDNLLKATKNYAQQEAEKGTENQYIKDFSTFMNCWEDFIEIEKKESNHVNLWEY